MSNVNFNINLFLNKKMLYQWATLLKQRIMFCMKWSRYNSDWYHWNSKIKKKETESSLKETDKEN